MHNPITPKIYIYNGIGVSKDSLWHTQQMFKSMLPPKYSVHTLNADQLKQGGWCEDAALFVLPGGADLPYVRRLTPKANPIIRNYIAKGGSFLGICAGSYYASSYVEFVMGSGDVIEGERELALFPDKAVGPCLLPYDHQTYSGACAANIQYQGQVIKLFFNGGGYFENATQYPEIQVLGHYCDEPNQPAAILQRHIGQGRVILSGVHFEYNPHHLDRSDDYLDHIAAELLPYETERQALIKELFSFLNFKCIDAAQRSKACELSEVYKVNN